MTFTRLLSVLGILLFSRNLHAQHKPSCAGAKNAKGCDSRIKTITSSTVLPVASYNAKGVAIRFINPFHFHYSTQVASTVINPPTPPAALAPAATFSGAVLPPSVSRVGSKACVQLSDTARNALATAAALSADKDYITCQWNAVIGDAADAQGQALQLKNAINDIVRAAFDEQQCYADRLRSYPGYVLSRSEMQNLRAFASANKTPIDDKGAPSPPIIGACARSNDDVWPAEAINVLDETFSSIQARLTGLIVLSGYKDWLADHKDANDLVTKSLADSITKVEAWQSVTDPYKSFTLSVSYNAFWRGVLANIDVGTQSAIDRVRATKSTAVVADEAIEITDNPFRFSSNLDCGLNYYGRGRIDQLTLHIVDQNSPPTSPVDVLLLTNTCYPPGAVSTGLGMSFVHDRVYSFVPGHDPATPTNTVLTLGTTTDASITPIYAIQYNTGLIEGSGSVGLHGSIGAAVGSTSGTTNLEFLVGPSLSLHRRAFFITPALQIARRDQLLPGYAVGNTQSNGLTSLPVVTNWKPGFALTFTFGIAP